MSSTTKKVAYNTGAQIAGKILVTLVAAVSVVILTRYLGPTDYGKYTLALAYLGLFGIFADVGLFTIVVREISRTPEKTEEIVGNVMTLRLVLAVLVILAAIGISYFLPYPPDVQIAIMIVGVSILFGLVNSSMVTVFQARLRMDYAVISDTLGRIVAFLAVVVVAWLNLGFYAIVWTAAIGAFATLIVTYYFARKLVRVRFLRDYKVGKELLISSLPLGLAIAIHQIYFRADAFILSLYRPFNEVGIYSLAYKLLEIVLSFAGFFYNSVFPVISRYVAKADNRLVGAVQNSFDLLVAAAVPVVVGGFLTAPQLIHLAGGAEFAGAEVLFQILLFAAGFAFVSGLFGYTLIAKDRVNSLLFLNTFSLVVNVGLNMIFIPIYGALAAAVLTTVSEFLVLVGVYFLIKKHLGFFPSFHRIPRVVLAAAIMGVFLWFAQSITILVTIPVAVVLYAAAAYYFKAIDVSVIQKLRKSA